MPEGIGYPTAINPAHVKLLQAFMTPTVRPQGQAMAAPGLVNQGGNPTMSGPTQDLMPDMIGWAQSPQGQAILQQLISGSVQAAGSRPQAANIKPLGGI